jgi:RNA polymerase sigma-70 factor (ECF subfamily)
MPDEERGQASHAPAARVDWGAFLSEHRERLRRMVALRLDDRLKGKIDASDVLQDVFVDVSWREGDYASDPAPMPPYLWLRFLTLQRLQIIQRKMLGTKARGGCREIPIHEGAFPAASSAALAAQLLGHDTRASEAAIRAERKLRLQQALEQLDPIDREVLVLRHFEQLTNGECARVLAIGESAATKRYLRALVRLKELLAALPGGSRDFRL